MIDVKSKSNLKTKIIEFDFDKEQPDNALTDFASSFNLFPVVLISNDFSGSGVTIAPSAIHRLKLFNNKFLPEIEMTCADEIGNLIDDFFPTDYDIILSIFVKSTAEDTFPIRMDFRITEYNPLQPSIENTIKRFTIKGILDAEDLHKSNFESFNKMTSYNVLKQVAESIGLGFATNITNTDDNMTWINPADSYLEFIQKVTDKAYISDNTFVWSFIDFYYNLNFVDIEKQLNEKPEELQSLNTVFVDNDGKESWVEQYLSTSDNLAMTNKFISKYNLNNQSTKINLESGYMFSSKWFNRTENTIEQVLTQENETKDDNLIQLRTQDDVTQKSRDGTFYGKIDEDNVHKNYFLAETLNRFNIEKLHKVIMVVTLQAINFEIKRFQNVMVDFVDINLLKDDTGIKEKLSGYWFVTGINYTYNRNGGSSQEITMVRRDLNLKHKELHDIRKIINEKNK